MFVEPMLLGSGLPAREGEWAVEVKWDGMRAQLRIDRGRWCVRSRPGRDCSDEFPELGDLAGALARHRLILDGELVCLAADGKPDFARMRRRLGASGRSAAGRLERTCPATFVAFDVLSLDGRAVRDLPYIERRALLSDLLDDGPSWQVPQHWIGEIEAVSRATAQHHLEGIVCKRLDSRYEAGRRSGSWRKHKHRRREVLAVTAWAPARPGLDEPDTLYLTRDDSGVAAAAGSVQLGVTGDLGRTLRGALVELEQGGRRRRVRAVAPGVRVAVDCHGAPDGPVRDAVVREIFFASDT